MNEHRLQNVFRALGFATALVLLAALFLFVCFAAPASVGVLINPHAEAGAIGLQVVIGICLFAFLTLMLCLPWAICALIRYPGCRTVSRLTVIGIALAVLLLLACVLGMSAIA